MAEYCNCCVRILERRGVVIGASRGQALGYVMEDRLRAESVGWRSHTETSFSRLYRSIGAACGDRRRFNCSWSFDIHPTWHDARSAALASRDKGSGAAPLQPLKERTITSLGRREGRRHWLMIWIFVCCKARQTLVSHKYRWLLSGLVHEKCQTTKSTVLGFRSPNPRMEIFKSPSIFTEK
jgi:hypothetical protein